MCKLSIHRHTEVGQFYIHRLIHILYISMYMYKHICVAHLFVGPAAPATSSRPHARQHTLRLQILMRSAGTSVSAPLAS